MMATLNVSLPESMKDFVECQLKERGYSTASEYVRDLIREAQKRESRVRLEQLLLKGIDSGDPMVVNDEFWLKLKKDVLGKASQRNVSRRKARR